MKYEYKRISEDWYTVEALARAGYRIVFVNVHHIKSDYDASLIEYTEYIMEREVQ